MATVGKCSGVPAGTGTKESSGVTWEERWYPDPSKPSSMKLGSAPQERVVMCFAPDGQLHSVWVDWDKDNPFNRLWFQETIGRTSEDWELSSIR